MGVLCRYEYPIAAVVGTFYLTAFQTIKVGRARKAAKIDYPQSASTSVLFVCVESNLRLNDTVYAEEAQAKTSKDALIFNCTQRRSLDVFDRFERVTSRVCRCTPKHP
jgi:glutathione S-transferase